MEQSTISLIVSVVALFVGMVALLKKDKPAPAPAAPATTHDSIPLQLQAYERLVLLTERLTLSSLISRMSQPGSSAKEFQAALLEAIKQEFEYNASQQIYVSNIAWEAVRNLRDQNMLIINQVAALLPPEASGSDLAKNVLEVLMQQQDSALHTIVLNALNFEAKKLLQ